MSKFLNTLSNSSMLGYNLLKALYSKQRVPLIVNYQVTTYCNLRCIYCYADLHSPKENKDLSTSEVFEDIDILYGLGTRWIRLMGGEPLMRDDIGAIIDYIKKKGIFCELNTNGYLVDKKIKDVRKVDTICMSADGGEDVTDFCRGRGCYKKVEEATKICHQNNLRVRYHACITKHTDKNAVDELAHLAKKYGYAFNFAQYSYATEMKDKISPTDDHVRDIFRVLIEYKKRGFPVLTSYHTLQWLIQWPFPYAKILYPEDVKKLPFSVKKCQYSRLNITLNGDGRVIPCTKLFTYGRNYHEIGMRKAIDYFDNIKCVACANAGELEMNLLLSFNPKAILNGFRHLV